jgi:hypothetical protein
VPPVSPYFRGTFWLSFFLMSGGITLLAWLARETLSESGSVSENSLGWGWGILLGILFVGTLVRSLPAERVEADPAGRNSLLVMT